ncbi:MAG: hypothetical protein NNA21_08485 [Nitrospira sp.]|nr:hypothetical protein [Nitrospira sp.]MCP9462174.1 hypothetical protein [Nitrospira sp.]MCP9474297.1 hypothetical protein [Nitrospira sp.]
MALSQRNRRVTMIGSRVFWICLVVGWSIPTVGDRVGAVQWETQEEKEFRLKQQAKGGLFQRWAFDQDRPNQTPAGFLEMAVGKGQPVAWTVQTSMNAPSPPNVVTVSADCDVKPCYQLLIAKGLNYEYPDLSVRFRGSQGIGGIVFGVRDAENFYATVVDLATSTARVIRMMEGNEQVLAQTSVSLKNTDWHTLRAQRNTIISKDFIEMFVDSVLVLSVEDQTLGLGQVGLLAGGRASLSFDLFHAAPLFSHRPLSPPPAY